MAELDFSHNVSEIPAGKALPEPYQRKVGVQPTQQPDFQSAMTQNAEATNWMSSVGSFVAGRASNAIAERLGNELGNKPQGDIGIPLTDFDQTMQKSYETQSQINLGLQADKLITDSNIEMANATRITPDLIRKTQASINVGLQKIYSLAPSGIQGNLSKIYGAAQLSQLEHLTNRMISEQHEDRRNSTILSNNKNAETAHALASSGKYDEAIRLLNTTVSNNNSAVQGNIGFSPQQAKVGADTVRQSAINGRLQYEYDQAVKQKKGPEYLNGLSKRPDWISDADYPSAIQSIRGYVNNQEALKSNFEELTINEFKNKMITDVSGITGTDLQSTLDKLSPINASKLKNDYAEAYRTYTKEHEEQNVLINNWQSAQAHANASEKIKNNTFNGKVAYVMNSSPNTSLDDAQAQVAASAGGTIPVFTETMKGKLWGGDAIDMVSVAKQIDKLQVEGSGHALNGLSDQDLALASDIKHNYNPADPASAARMISENRENQDARIRKESEDAFSFKINDNTRRNNTTTDDYILNTFGMNGGWFGSGFDSPWSKSTYATDILANYRTNFINTRRDDTRAQALTKQYIANNYGKTSINGNSEWALHPIETACGFGEGEGTSIINSDIMRQLEEPLKKQKALFDDKKSEDYWTLEPVIGEKSSSLDSVPTYPEVIAKPYINLLNNAQSHANTKELQRLNFVRHVRNGIAMDTETYPLRLVGNNFNWDLNLDTANGPISVFLKAPAIGVHTYTPDLKWIKEQSNGR